MQRSNPLPAVQSSPSDFRSPAGSLAKWLVILAFVVLIGGIVSFRLLTNISEGIESLPLGALSVIFSVLVIVSVAIATSKSKRIAGKELIWVGNLWMLSTIPLTFDYLIDSFDGKVIIIALFALAGFLYWKGVRNNWLGFMTSIVTTTLVAGDGLGHLRGEHCISSGFTACPVKAVSDFYLFMVLLILSYGTVSIRDRRPNLYTLLLTAFIAVSLFVGFGLSG